jgi:hypothetical protein
MSFATKDIKIKKSARPSGRGTEGAARGRAIKADDGGTDDNAIDVVQKIKSYDLLRYLKKSYSGCYQF